MSSVREFLDEWIPDSNREQVSAEIYQWLAGAWDQGFETRTDWRSGPDAFPPSNPYRSQT